MSDASWKICKIVEEALREIGVTTTIHYEERHQRRIDEVIAKAMDTGTASDLAKKE